MFTRLSGSGLRSCAGDVLLGAALLTISAGALAGPRVIEESVKITRPDPTYVWPSAMAVDGDWLLVGGAKYLDDMPNFVDNSVWAYHRESNGSWTLMGRVHQSLVEEDGDEPSTTVAMSGGVAAIVRENLSWIYERNGTTWTQVPSPLDTDGMSVQVNDGTIVVSSGHCDWIASAYRKAANGAWTLVRRTDGEGIQCENEDTRGSVDVSGNAVIVATYSDQQFSNSARIYEGPFGSTPVLTRLTNPPGNVFGFSDFVAIDGATAIASGSPPAGAYVYTRAAAGTWNRNGNLIRPDSLAVDDRGAAIARGGFAVAGAVGDNSYGRRSGSVAVYQRNSNGTYRYAAKLVPSDRGPETGQGLGVSISGRRVAASNVARGALYIYDLPTSLTEPATKQDNFEDGNASDWTFTAGSSFTVATTSTSRVYRQSSTAGNATSLLSNTDFRNQAVEADIKPTAFATSTGDKWLGLATRYIDASNYYYVTLRNNNTVQLRKIVNGAFSTLASAPLPVTLNRSYRVRIEASGTRLRVYVDNQLQAEARDSALTHGQAGVIMYRTRADYDNILVSANPLTTLATYKFRNSEIESPSNWEQLGTWDINSDGFFVQSSTTAGAHAAGGVATGDQVVEARMRRTGSAGTNNWFGLAARFRNASNYYYVTLRNNNIISLRKLVNGAIVELDSAPFTVTTNTWYLARLEAVGNQLRVYVDNQLRLDATDSTHASGRYGPVMYRTAAQYDDILAEEP